jgi:MFS transporter, DHA2 family, methylenomycin A resistance protein
MTLASSMILVDQTAVPLASPDVVLGLHGNLADGQWILAGASAFFAAVGPVLGGVLTAINWRLVFLVDVPLALGAIVLTLVSTPDLKPDP